MAALAALQDEVAEVSASDSGEGSADNTDDEVVLETEKQGAGAEFAELVQIIEGLSCRCSRRFHAEVATIWMSASAP